MSGLFYGCNSLKSLPDISKWDTSNVTDMSGLFEECKSLKALPDISNWNLINVMDLSDLFSGCSSLLSLPDISKCGNNNPISNKTISDNNILDNSSHNSNSNKSKDKFFLNSLDNDIEKEETPSFIKFSNLANDKKSSKV